ncbi:MAG: dihydroneopterin aldolase [Bacteroidetes bacterium]|nr:dihydroneopterin aldolase [Bacteroidota bacterium]MBL7105426.1 dihydroneopterin aldolase [Bacteroidales bacterium]
MSTISIEGMEFHAYHGCLPEEQVIGNKFIIDLYIETDTSKAEESDNLEDTVNYSEVYNLVKKEMDIKSKLLEHVGRRILNSLKTNLSQVEDARLKVSKMNPSLGGPAENVSLTLKYDV